MARYGFSTSLSKLISSISSARKLQEKKELVESQAGKKIKAGPFFSLARVDFNKKTRTTHITFKQVEQYKKIERYVTINYVKNPIYSDEWTIKEKDIKKNNKTNKQRIRGAGN